jgi:ribose-phosphate pyrophosphokinase
MNKTPYTIDLDQSFRPFIRYSPLGVSRTTFHGGEPHFSIKFDEVSDEDYVYITQRFNSTDDIVMILIAADAARRAGFKHLGLVLPYFPAARQDRVCNPGESLTVKVFADMINSCGFEDVAIYSPHSEVTPALLNNVNELDLDVYYIKQIVKQYHAAGWGAINIVCPDAGAGKRVAKLAKAVANEYLNLRVNLIRCEKVRDVSDGSLKEFYVAADDLQGLPTIICDDIVSMGGTFIGLGDRLRERNCGKLVLFTSHADAQAGLNKMALYFDKVYTSNSKRDWTLTEDAASKLDTLTVFNIKI